MKVLVTGGYYDDGGDGVIWAVDLERERAEVFLRWQPPPPVHVPTKGFAGAGRAEDGTLFVAAHGAIVRIDPARAKVTGTLHQPCMNDLHHVTVHGDRLLVANTGLDAVDVFGTDGTFVGSHSLLPAWVNARRMSGQTPPSWDEATRPGWSGEAPAEWSSNTTSTTSNYYSTDAPFHRCKLRDHLHPNHVVCIGDRVLTTCFADGTVRDLARLEVMWREPGAYVHDGFPHGDSLWFTAIDGQLFELDAHSFEEKRRLSLFDVGHCGWCRGLLVTDQHLVVGLTEVRTPRLPRHRWAERDPGDSETSVLLLDRRDGRLLARVDLTDRIRHSKVYEILPLEKVVS